ncbi:MAG TPA: SGNH/GDSL hydrolase family protein [Solirubrobacterales bacterium]|nr:SGNH/GDSL hydrolase family protein [Solirubrobacterales bacterium]
MRANRNSVLLFFLVAALCPAAAIAKAPPQRVEIGKVALGSAADGRPAVLVSVSYPIRMAGRKAPLAVTALDATGEPIARAARRFALSAGKLRRPERRRRFTFVHRLYLPIQVVRAGMPIRVAVGGARSSQTLTLERGGRALCSTVEAVRTRPGQRTVMPLPACTSQVRWRVARQPQHGSAHVEGDSLVYRSGPKFRGADSLLLPAGGQVRLTVSSIAPDVRVRALGDSVTAGFGYFSNATPMKLKQLFGCRPPAQGYDDACSSNSIVTSNKQPEVEYATDFGLANNVSWAAQWANEHGLTDYANYAVSGSEPSDWAPGGEFHATTERLEAEDPDYVLMTIGANPLLSEMLFGVDNMDCAVSSDIFGGYRECVEAAFAEVKLQANLKALYADLVKNTDATIFLMQYHLSVPSVALAYSATQIAEMGKLLNREIAAVAAEVNPRRLQVVSPPHFDVGIDISPVYPSNFSCSRLGYEVDGPSVQSTPTQDELDVLHPLSFCEGPAGGGEPWVISGDTGIHPSVAGYAQMASQVPAPE